MSGKNKPRKAKDFRLGYSGCPLGVRELARNDPQKFYGVSKSKAMALTCNPSLRQQSLFNKLQLRLLFLDGN